MVQVCFRLWIQLLPQSARAAGLPKVAHADFNVCVFCCHLLLQTQLTSYATTKAHYESKHPKEAVPPQEQFDK
jgi:hypothetical protein